MWGELNVEGGSLCIRRGTERGKDGTDDFLGKGGGGAYVCVGWRGSVCRLVCWCVELGSYNSRDTILNQKVIHNF